MLDPPTEGPAEARRRAAGSWGRTRGSAEMLLDDRRCEEETEEVRRAMGGIYGEECSPTVCSCPEEWICFFSDFSDTLVMFKAL